MKRAVVPRAPLGRPPAFSRDDIVQRAMELLDADGADGLTLRGVARRLGTALGTLYNYFDNLADLEDAVAARLIAQLPVLDAARPLPLRAQLVELGLALIRTHSLHPYLRHVLGEVSVETGTRMLRQNRAALLALGLSEDDASLCMEVVQSVAYNRGGELYRLRRGGEPAVRLYDETWRRAGRRPPLKFTAANLTPAKLEPFHRELLERAIDAVLRGLGHPLDAQ